MTFCVGTKLDEGLILASGSRAHAGVDSYANFCGTTSRDQRAAPAYRRQPPAYLVGCLPRAPTEHAGRLAEGSR